MKLGTAYVDIKGKRDGLKSDLDAAKRDVTNASSSMEAKIAAIDFRSIGLAATAFAAVVGYGMKQAIDSASALQEVTSKFGVVFGEQAAIADSWAKILVDDYAMSTREARQYLSSIQDLLVPMGMNAEAAATMSNEVVKLSADLGSFNNLPTSAVMDDIQSALVGNYETMKKYGVVLNAAGVQERALTMGLADSKDALTAAHKAQAAYQMIVEGSSAAIGDMARTSDSYANQTKKLTSNIENLKAKLGEELLPVATDFVSSINKLFAENEAAFSTFATGLSGMVGATADIAKSVVEISNAISGGITLHEFFYGPAGPDGLSEYERNIRRMREAFDKANRPSQDFDEDRGGELWYAGASDFDDAGMAATGAARTIKKATTEAFYEMTKEDEKWLDSYLKNVDAQLDAEQEKNEQIGELFMLEKEWEADERKVWDDYNKKKDEELARDKLKIAKQSFEAQQRLANRTWREMAGDSENFFKGLSYGFADATDDVETWGERGYWAAKEFADASTDALAGFLNPLKDEFLSLDSLVQGVFERMVDYAANAVAEMAVEWAIAEGMDFLSNYFHAGNWDVKPDERAAILQTGEMVIPRDTSESIRGTFGSMEDLQDFVNSMEGRTGGDLTDSERAGLAAAGKTLGIRAAVGGSLLAQGKISAGDFAEGMTSPTAATGAFSALGTDFATHALGVQSGKVADFFGLVGQVAGAAYGGKGGAVVGGTAGQVLGDLVADLADVRENEAIRDALEEMNPGYFAGRQATKGLQGIGEFGSPTAWGATEIAPGVYAGGMDPGGGESTGSGAGTGGGRGGETESTSDASGGMGGVLHGGWTDGPMSGFDVTHHGRELTLNMDQVRAVRELNAGGNRPINITVMIGGEKFDARIAKVSDGVRVEAERRNMGTQRIY